MTQMDLQTLSAKVAQLEQQLAHLEREVRHLQQTSEPEQHSAQKANVSTYRIADKAALRQQFDQLLVDLKIERSPRGALALQREIAEAGLGSLELSAGIIAMREE